MQWDYILKGMDEQRLNLTATESLPSFQTKLRKSAEFSSSSPTHQKSRVKQEICREVLKKLREANKEELQDPNFENELIAHFARLPTRYALDVSADRAEDVLTHKRLLAIAEYPENRPAFHVRPVHLVHTSTGEEGVDGEHGSPVESPRGSEEGVNFSSAKPRFPPPAFGSSPNLEQLATEIMSKPAGVLEEDSGIEAAMQASLGNPFPHLPMHEVTFSTLDKPKLLSQLSAVVADVGLNIREAHVFSTADGYSLDVFVVDGWPTEDTEDLAASLQQHIDSVEEEEAKSSYPIPDSVKSAVGGALAQDGERVRIPSDGTDEWEIDSEKLVLHNKVAAGSFGDLYRGTYCGQDVAIKILKSERLNDSLQQEFAQEVYIMRKVRHKNVVQFIGACTKPPNLSIVTEFMSGGSVYDYLRSQRATMRLPMLLRVAVDVARGMDFLHKNNIIHRDLKAANLLMDEYAVVKVADFGVARVQANSGVMTAETGTYRWMAPEVIKHGPYDHKADIFSFGIVLWELLTGKLPYSDLTPLQAAVNVVQRGLRPPIPRSTHPKVVEMMQRCWHDDPAQRPEFSQLVKDLQELAKEVEEEGEEQKKDRKKGFFSVLKRPAQAPK